MLQCHRAFSDVWAWLYQQLKTCLSDLAENTGCSDVFFVTDMLYYFRTQWKAANCGRFRFWRRHRQSMGFCLCMKYLGYRWTDLRQILVPRSDEFEGQGQRSTVKVTGAKNHFSALWAICVRFMFGETSLASSWNLSFWSFRQPVWT